MGELAPLIFGERRAFVWGFCTWREGERGRERCVARRSGILVLRVAAALGVPRASSVRREGSGRCCSAVRRRFSALPRPRRDASRPGTHSRHLCRAGSRVTRTRVPLPHSRS